MRKIKMTKEIKKKIKNEIVKKVAYTNMIAASLLMLIEPVSAADSNTSTLDSFITFICDWLIKIGGVVALIGGVTFAIGWSRDDADSKARALLAVMAGFMIMGIGKAPSVFGL